MKLDFKKKKENSTIKRSRGKISPSDLRSISSILLFPTLTMLSVFVISSLPQLDHNGDPQLDHNGGREYKESIVALGAGSEVEGDSYLGVGTLDSVPIYKYMVKEEDGTLSTKIALASESEIHYIRDGEKPYVEVERERSLFETISEYEFYLPEGSVKENIEINLED